ncbi:hypothetical protein [Agrobacterium tumefaciens]|uniref:hypothetical protein n=1 Tax=Agrobacterium tumefaciens TaxID=358 RepID=UPI002859A847|nr:hypothetical protein [Agrobacterium tumefaciens]MDR6587419.1 hypothetical protein [Agrobacterium tumefaciens]
MAPRKSRSTKLLNPDFEGAQHQDQSPENSSPSSSSQSLASSRHVSPKQLAEVLNRDSNTVMKYLGQGMPAVEHADRDRGIAWVIDTASGVSDSGSIMSEG